jgi:hypothetical protein
MANTLAEWFDGDYRRPNESRAQATARLQTESGLGFSTLYYALRGGRVQPATAKKLEEASGGAVKAAELVLAPTRGELRDGQNDGSDPMPGAA